MDKILVRFSDQVGALQTCTMTADLDHRTAIGILRLRAGKRVVKITLIDILFGGITPQSVAKYLFHV